MRPVASSMFVPRFKFCRAAKKRSKRIVASLTQPQRESHLSYRTRRLGCKTAARAVAASQKQPASAREPATQTPAAQDTATHSMAEDKKSRACHYLQQQEWWFADKTPIESVFLMMS